MNNNKLVTALKGTIVGGTMLVPGVSGGSMAMILGIYEGLIAATSSFMDRKKENFYFLLTFSLGGGLGMLLFAAPLLQLIERFPMPMLYFFLGAVAGGIPLMLKQAQIPKFSWKVLVYPCFGLFIVLLLSMLPASSFKTNFNTGVIGIIFLLVSGFIAAIALVLPGISVSYLLLVIGMYDATMQAISQIYFPFLIPLGIGLLLGVICSTKFLDHALSHHPQAAYLTILGFILGSMVEVFPGIPSGFELLFSLGMVFAGFITIYLLSRRGMP